MSSKIWIEAAMFRKIASKVSAGIPSELRSRSIGQAYAIVDDIGSTEFVRLYTLDRPSVFARIDSETA